MLLKTPCDWWPLAPFHWIRSKSVSFAWIVANSLRLHGLWSTRLLCPWNSPGKNTGVGSHSIFQGIFSTQGSVISKSSQKLFLGTNECCLCLYRSWTSPWHFNIWVSFVARAPGLHQTWPQKKPPLQRLTYSGFLTAELPQGQELPASTPLLHLTWENETSAVETHKWKSPQEGSPWVGKP